jgi:hypothetical protein
MGSAAGLAPSRWRRDASAAGSARRAWRPVAPASPATATAAPDHALPAGRAHADDLLAGALRHEFRRFASATFFPVLLWTPLFVGAVCLSGEAALGWVDALGVASWLAALSLLALWWLLTKLLMPLAARWLRRDDTEIDDGGRAA